MHILNFNLAKFAAALLFVAAPLASSSSELPPPPERLFERADISKVPSEPPAAMTQSEFSHDGVTGSYFLFTPPTTLSAIQVRPLVVFLHGCSQTAEDFAMLTKMNELAIRENFYVLYPQQSKSRNASNCWNWFEPVNQGSADLADSASQGSELNWIAALTEKMVDELNADADRVYVSGLSAGAAMTVNLLSCYPDMYAGGGVFSGLPFAAASNTVEALSAMAIGSRAPAAESASKAFACAGEKTGRPLSVLVVHGTLDATVNARNAKKVVSHFAELNDLRDDGEANESATLKLIKRKLSRAKRRGNPYTTEDFKTSNGAEIRLVTIKRMGHAWSGGATEARFSEAKGPIATDLLWNFFLGLPKAVDDVSNATAIPNQR